jgi:hypothetical protein
MGTGSPSVLPEGKKIDVLKYAACPSLWGFNKCAEEINSLL